jgi:hypothetical protein
MIAPYAGELGLDSCVELFQSNSRRLLIETDPFPFEATSSALTRFTNFEPYPRFSRTKLMIDSRQAILVTYFDAADPNQQPYKAAVSVEIKGGLRIFFSSKDEDDLKRARLIFLSVELTK